MVSLIGTWANAVPVKKRAEINQQGILTNNFASVFGHLCLIGRFLISLDATAVKTLPVFTAGIGLRFSF
jgi:hypothetical protein